MKNMIGGVATTHFVMQKLFTVQKEKHLAFFHFKVELGSFVFDEENHEQKSRKFFGRTCSRFLLVFMS